MYKSAIVHYRNKYPGSKVEFDDEKVDVYDCDGRWVVALRKLDGQWKCVSKEFGCKDQHDLSPIPKDTRVWKLYPSGEMALAEEHKVRAKIAKKVMVDGKIPSIEELVTPGLAFDHNWSVRGEASEEAS